MSAAAPTLEDVSTETSVDESLVEVRLDDLIVGRPLLFPVYDDEGLLLLAGGTLISSELRQKLKQRNIGTIRVQRSEAGRISLSESVLAGKAATAQLSLDSAVAMQLDKAIDSGLVLFQNHGPAMKQQVVFHGRKAYDLEKHSILREQRVATGESLNNMMKEALHGRSVNSGTVNQLVAQFLGDLSDDTDNVLAVAMEATGDASLADHSFKMSMLGAAIGIEMGMNEENCRKICAAGMVHDWGMAKVPVEVRNAPRLLSNSEFFPIMKHPIHTAEMLEKLTGIPSMVPMIAYQVHERPNGLGYPRGRSGDRIHILARILAVADVFTALLEEKPHRKPLTPYGAMECLVRMARSRDVDPEVVRALLKVICLFPIGSFVTLDDGSVAQVLRRNGDKYATPIIRRIQDENGNPVPDGDDAAIIDLAESTVGIVQALPTPGRDEIPLTDQLAFPIRER